MANPIITLTTDYGTDDHLVGVLKGVILKINPDAQIIDITHAVAAYDLLDGALQIASAYAYFPPRTIHVIIVDPGVGTERRPILVSGQNQYFVAPDNGVLSAVYDREQNFTVRHLTSEHYFNLPVSKTFHGRDVFAPVAAWLSKHWQPASMGEVIEDFKRFAMPKPKEANGSWKGVVLKVDSFGNLITNFRAEDLSPESLEKGQIQLHVGNHNVTRMVHMFASGNAGEPVAYMGSSGYLEVAVNKGNAAKQLGIGRGTPVVLDKR
ncbi:MAG TPA: SAM-dependent chlorinase/fluorinase [Candidatus Sulfotelmatobacter sp.]|nr:SAM-dependent chlorinase/fluorinase [Candidatus Sulfotelmatobacter sp.]